MKQNTWIIDAHQDLAWNMLTFGRDYNLAAGETRRQERTGQTPARNGDTLLGWPDYQRGQVALIFATLFAAPARRSLGDWDAQSYRDPAGARQRYHAQLDAYHRLVEEHPKHFHLVQNRADLQATLASWSRVATQAGNPQHPVGLVILMEGAEAITDPAEVETWYRRGVRIIGPAWAGTRFCGGTREPGPLTNAGYALLESMAQYNLALDLSHMDAQAARQALDSYPGTVIASHANAAALLKGFESNRFLPDDVIASLVERDGVIGIVPFNKFLQPGWTISAGRQAVTLDEVVAQIDYICQLAGDACHVGLGTDFDGGFGLQSVPAEIDTIADLRLLIPLLAQKGYTETDIAAVMGKNWARILERVLTES
ncbi:MAG: membrane dipeptidase [Anaerolineales bacterium]|nr:membrane dipeptidase [Anaerolineales bacterium]